MMYFPPASVNAYVDRAKRKLFKDEDLTVWFRPKSAQRGAQTPRSPGFRNPVVDLPDNSGQWKTQPITGIATGFDGQNWQNMLKKGEQQSFVQKGVQEAHKNNPQMNNRQLNQYAGQLNQNLLRKREAIERNPSQYDMDDRFVRSVLMRAQEQAQPQAKRNMLIAPTIPGAGVGSTARGRIENVGQVNPSRSTNRQQSEREGSQLTLTWPATFGASGAGLSGAFPTQLPGMAPSGYAQQQRSKQQQQIQMNQQIAKQIQEEDAANRMTSAEANARALELRNFFQR